MPHEVRHQRCGARRVGIVHADGCGAEVHQREGDCPAGAACADENRRLALDAGAPEPLLDVAPEADAIRVVADGAAIVGDGHAVDGADLLGLERYLVEQRHDGLFAGEGNIDAVEARGLDGGQQVLEAAAGQAVEVHQVVGAADAGGGEGVLVQRR